MSKKPTVVKNYKPPISLKKSKKIENEVIEPEIKETEKTDEEDNDDIDDDEEDEEENEEEDEEDENFDDEIIYDEDGNICNIQKVFEDDNEYYDNDDEIEAQPDISVEYVLKEDRQSSAKLTKYEMVRILGERTKQLTMGAKPLIKNLQDPKVHSKLIVFTINHNNNYPLKETLIPIAKRKIMNYMIQSKIIKHKNLTNKI